jgi:hypothetical protein
LRLTVRRAYLEVNTDGFMPFRVTAPDTCIVQIVDVLLQSVLKWQFAIPFPFRMDSIESPRDDLCLTAMHLTRDLADLVGPFDRAVTQHGISGAC